MYNSYFLCNFARKIDKTIKYNGKRIERINEKGR